MKKKIGAIFMAGVMTCTVAASLMLAGCGGNKIVEFVMPEGGFDTSKEVTITFYHTMGKALREQLDAELEFFKQLYPNITVEHKQVGGYDDVRNQINTEIMGNKQPNISYCYPDHVALYNRSKAVLALNDFLADGEYKNMTVKQVKVNEYGETITDDDGNPVYEDVSLNMTQAEQDMFIDGFFQEGYQYDDGTKMYTLPFAKSTEVLYYNKTYFDAHDLKVPTTWKEMEAVCERILEITEEENAGKADAQKDYVIPFGYDSEANWFITMCEQYGSPYTSATGEKYLFDNQQNKDFVKMLKGWYDKGYFTTQTIYKAYTSGLFTNVKTGPTNQKSYMCIGSSAGAKNQQAPKTDTGYAFEVGIAPIPQVYSTDPTHEEYKEGYQPKVISQGPSVCIFKNADPQKVIASWLLVKYLSTSPYFQAAFSEESGYLPALEMEYMRENEAYAGLLDSANGFANITALSAKACFEQSDSYYTSPAFVGSSKARDEVGLLMQAVFTATNFTDGTLNEAFANALEECKYFG